MYHSVQQYIFSEFMLKKESDKAHMFIQKDTHCSTVYNCKYLEIMCAHKKEIG